MEPWEEHFLELAGEVRVACICQQRNVPAEYGCHLCEGDGYRTVQVRRNGTTRISTGVHDPGWTPWKEQG